MQTLIYQFPAKRTAMRAAHIGVVASGDLEILIEPSDTNGTPDTADIRVRTSVNGFDTVWHHVLQRFFTHTPLAGRWELNDFGATPAVVTLRLRQAAEASEADSR